MHNTDHTSSADSGLSRRSFLERLFTAAVAGAVAPSILFGRVAPRITQTATGFTGLYTLDLNDIPLLQIVGGSIRLVVSEIDASFRIIVTRVSETQFEAVNARCPHEGELVIARRGSNDFLQCSAHESRFQFDGTFISGPADGKNLTRYATTFDGVSILQVEIDALAGIEESAGTSTYVKVHSTGPLPGQVVFEFALEKAASVTLGIWSLDGREVLRPLDEHREAGTHRLPCDTSSLAAGMYLYRLVTAGSVLGTGKLVVRK